MAAASDYTKENVINALLRGVAFPLPAKTHLALHTDAPGGTGANEVLVADWPAYVRKEAEAGGLIGSGWDAPASGVTQNANQLTYPSNDGAASVTVSHWSIWDAATGGNCLAVGALTTARTLQVGDVFVFDINSLDVTMA